MRVSPGLLWLLIATNVATLCAVGFLVVTGFAFPRRAFEEISAERINIVSPSGKTVIAISNKERIAPPALGGKVYPVSVSEGREHMAGMIFFNQTGDEMGGLLFNSFRLPNGRIAGIGHLSFDRYGDNQVIALQYNENATSVQSGLRFFDRPADGTFKASLDLIEEAQAASPERAAEIRRTLADMSNKGALGVERVFVGSRNQVAQVLLRDSRGRVRARLLVDGTDEARLEFLNEFGDVAARFPR
ncbi:MAG: hypothetical protein AB1806_08060 [Acidobacteriota bacterium]